MRLFIAALLDEGAVSELSRLRDALHDASSAGSFVPRENLHITLEFLGECTPEERDSAAEAVDGLRFEPFSFAIDRLGVFQRPDGDIWWAGMEESRALLRLQSELHRDLMDRGFRLEKRRYRPHITLGRRVMTSMCCGRIDRLEAAVESVSLMLSERSASGMVYTELFANRG